MSEFFSNVWLWISTNIPYVVSVISSADFIATAGALFAIFKSNKSTKNNTLSIKDVNKTMKTFTNIDEDVQVLKEDVHTTSNAVDANSKELSKMQTQLDEFVSNIDNKLNAIIEVQRIVYSTIKDDTIRASVNNVLVSAKHLGTKAKAELQSEIDELKKSIKNTVENISNVVNDKLDEVSEKTVGNVDTNVDSYTRY